MFGYADSNHGVELVKGRSLAYYIFTLFRCVICWKAILQHAISLWIIESKHISMNEGINECVWLYGFVQSLL